MSSGTRILLVDDEPRILETFSMLLGDLGYYVKTASDGYTALTLVSDETFDIVFLDQFLGTVTGLDLMQQMLEINPELYFVIITAHGNTDLAVESLKKGASDFITKPFFVADLTKSIAYVNEKRGIDAQKKKAILTLKTEVNEKTEEMKKTHLDVLLSLAQAIEKRDFGTCGHSKRVSHYSSLIATSLNLTEVEKNDLTTAALLHDIGKIGISDFILGKQGPLTQNETLTVRNHPEKGVEILKPLKQFKPILPAILHHHENYDGFGYPYGLVGRDIPLLARIISVADTYDAILSTRPYRAAAKHNEAIDELIRFRGKQFDPEIVRAFAGSFSGITRQN
jgi:putative two-component system response regulator